MERDIKILLELLLKRICEESNSKYPIGGMCIIISIMQFNDIITFEEAMVLSDYLRKHKPFSAKVYGWWCTSSYWWPENHFAPRINWLRKQINSLS